MFSEEASLVKSMAYHACCATRHGCKTLQSIAGHADIKMTLERYAHERENNVIAAGSLIGGVFRSM